MSHPLCETRDSYNITEYKVDALAPAVAIHFITSLTAVVLNSVVIASILKSTTLKGPSWILLASLSSTDLLLGLIAQPSTAMYYISAFENHEFEFCLSWLLLTRIGYTLGCVGLLIIAAMSIDRCLAITMLNRYKTIVTRRKTMVVVVSFWISGCGAAAGHLSYYMTIGFGSVLLSVILVSFLVGFYSLRKASVKIFPKITPNGNGSRNARNPLEKVQILRYRHSLNTMVMIFTLNLIVYLPTITYVALEYVYTFPQEFNVALYQYIGVLIGLSSTINPISYVFRLRELRKAVRKLIPS